MTQIVEGGDDNDVIDLTDILEKPDQALDAVVEPEEAVIPLVDAIPTETSVDVTDDTDDEIIDLTEVTSAPKTPAVEPIAESAPVFSEDDVDEEVIDLMDVATTRDTDVVEADPDVPAGMAEEPVRTTQDEDDVIDLLDVATIPEADTAETDLQGQAAVPEETAGTMEEDEPTIDVLDAVEPQTAEAETIVAADDEFARPGEQGRSRIDRCCGCRRILNARGGGRNSRTGQRLHGLRR